MLKNKYLLIYKKNHFHKLIKTQTNFTREKNNKPLNEHKKENIRKLL